MTKGNHDDDSAKRIKKARPGTREAESASKAAKKHRDAKEKQERENQSRAGAGAGGGSSNGGSSSGGT
ncbi:hypothetical protein BP6252_09285 [Coleophoma cylindrospora]|uniref:Uncharacterized protein n=1 Tax=Coleophoma cylindrospora TaxID=1849047 RepID=A0A3D8R1I0_9HELO|nr:hypothetical protein BP6252_09285 [Coleophoma cylindrospora]